MDDIISINRQFLIMAREVANSKSGEIVTGLPKPVLDRLAGLTIDQIEALARVGVSLMTVRLTVADIDQLLRLKDSGRSAYMLSVLAHGGRQGG
ncbi:hypothetical protein [Pelomicrobium methylotrophicum]|uniref:Flagellar transcriptional regulator FlhD n=1 Tax=Pelomicrobium methylotrophicum TaxID=2602750 RepID=A0A5C7EYP7_9PROT|nr:hypothetical protein [Pelomicrobium methylotrophicum]TXF13551.1 hypothetical protein FR698_00020 [Pelomicrobium methylotrophicum]